MFCASDYVAREFGGLWFMIPQFLFCELLCFWCFGVCLTSYTLNGSCFKSSPCSSPKSGLGSLSCLVKCILTLSMERR